MPKEDKADKKKYRKRSRSFSSSRSYSYESERSASYYRSRKKQKRSSSRSRMKRDRDDRYREKDRYRNKDKSKEKLSDKDKNNDQSERRSSEDGNSDQFSKNRSSQQFNKQYKQSGMQNMGNNFNPMMGGMGEFNPFGPQGGMGMMQNPMMMGPGQNMKQFMGPMAPMQPGRFNPFGAPPFIAPFANILGGDMPNQMGINRHNKQKFKDNKFGDKDKLDDNFVIFKNRNFPPVVTDVLRNMIFSLNVADPQLIIRICKKALYEIEKKCKENGLKRIAKQISEETIPFLEGEQKKEAKELKKKNKEKESKENKDIQEGKENKDNKEVNNTKDVKSVIPEFNEGIKNIDFEILKMIHNEIDIDQVIQKIKIEKTKVNLNTVPTKIDTQFSENKLFESALNYFNAEPENVLSQNQIH